MLPPLELMTRQDLTLAEEFLVLIAQEAVASTTDAGSKEEKP